MEIQLTNADLVAASFNFVSTLLTPSCVCTRNDEPSGNCVTAKPVSMFSCHDITCRMVQCILKVWRTSSILLNNLIDILLPNSPTSFTQKKLVTSLQNLSICLGSAETSLLKSQAILIVKNDSIMHAT
jgi:hypothetical protein